MLKLYFNDKPGGKRIALFLEEAGLPYEAFAGAAPHHGDYAPVPSIVDEIAGARVFGGTPTLLYLANKIDLFLPQKTEVARRELLSWLAFLDDGVDAAADAVSYFHTLDERLKNRRYLVSYMYTIADMGLWEASQNAPAILGEHAWEQFPHLKRHHDDIGRRPAAVRVLEQPWEEPFRGEILVA